MLQHTCCVNYHAISLDNSLKLSTGSRPEVPCKKCVLKNFAKFAGKTSVPETLCRLKVAGLRNFIYKLPHKLLIRLNKTLDPRKRRDIRKISKLHGDTTK